jgi:hypothetical protein
VGRTELGRVHLPIRIRERTENKSGVLLARGTPERRLAIAIFSTPSWPPTMPLGSVGYESQTNEKGDRLTWLEPHIIAKLKALAGRARATATLSFALQRHACSDQK